MVFQLKRAKETKEWHPHLHIVLDSDYIPQEKLSKEWQACTGTSSIVDIRAVRSTKAVAEYVSRYCARPAKLVDFNEEDCIEMFKVFHNRKLCGTWGSGRKISLRPQKSKDKDKWIKIGSWKAVISQADSLPRAKAVLEAFKTNGTVPAGLIINEIKEGIDKYLDHEIPKVGFEDLVVTLRSFCNEDKINRCEKYNVRRNSVTKPCGANYR